MTLKTYRLDLPTALVESVVILAESESEALALFNAALAGHQDAVNRVTPCQRESLACASQMRIRSAAAGTPKEKRLISERLYPASAMIQIEVRHEQ